MAEEKEKEGKITIKLPKFNLWILISLVLAIALVLSIIQGWSITGKATGVLSSNDTAKKAIDYINNNLVQEGTSASLISTEDAGSMYNIIFSYQGNQYSFYMTKDGKYLTQSVWDTSKQKEQPKPEEIPKTDKPTVQLYVMSFCPYGIEAEKTMKPVVDLLGSKVAIEPHFIVSISGTTINSLHGEYEANEDMRQACVWKNYGQATFWKYVDYISNNCNKDNIDTCWKDAAKNASVDVTKIETCVTNQGLDLMKADNQLTTSLGISGSPTLIINGVKSNIVYSYGNSEAYKEAICGAFTTPPSECSKTLGDTGSTTPAGGCE